jgi:hypothetical protein
MFTRVTRPIVVSALSKQSTGIRTFISVTKAGSRLTTIPSQQSWLRTAQAMRRTFAAKKDDDDPKNDKNDEDSAKSDLERFEEQKAKRTGNKKPEVNEFWEEADAPATAEASKVSAEAGKPDTTDSGYSASEEEAAAKPRRKRRSKAEIEAEK